MGLSVVLGLRLRVGNVAVTGIVGEAGTGERTVAGTVCDWFCGCGSACGSDVIWS